MTKARETFFYKRLRYEFMKEGGLCEEIMKNRFHPRNINLFKGWDLLHH